MKGGVVITEGRRRSVPLEGRINARCAVPSVVLV